MSEFLLSGVDCQLSMPSHPLSRGAEGVTIDCLAITQQLLSPPHPNPQTPQSAWGLQRTWQAHPITGLNKERPRPPPCQIAPCLAACNIVPHAKYTF
jgi:hypothetical protein